MFYLNRIVWFFMNPLAAPLFAAIAGAALSFGDAGRRRRAGRCILIAALASLWCVATPAFVALVGLPLERPYLETASVGDLPSADAAVLLGGGVGKVDGCVYPDIFESGDRVWHAARLYRAGKVPKIVVSGDNDESAAVPLLLDLGVPREAIVVDNESRNTYENSRFSEKLLPKGAKVLLVTSAWHMPRALGNFSQTSLDVVPAACDFSAHNAWYGGKNRITAFFPGPDNIMRSNFLLKEWLGRLARK